MLDLHVLINKVLSLGLIDVRCLNNNKSLDSQVHVDMFEVVNFWNKSWVCWENNLREPIKKLLLPLNNEVIVDYVTGNWVVKEMVIGLREKGDDERWQVWLVCGTTEKHVSVHIWGDKPRSLKLGRNGSVRVSFSDLVEKAKESSSILWFRQECLMAMCSNAPHVGYDMRVGLSNLEVLLFSSFLW